jgi:hypothetical protein
MKHLLFLLALAACGDPDVAPSATITATTPDSLAPDDDANDDLTITVRYDDGDGDLGEGIAEVHDCRSGDLITELLIPAIAPDGIVGDHITGTLELHVNDVGAIEAPALSPVCGELGIQDVSATAATFCVVLVDVAGHRGDGDCTPAIALQ